MRKVPSPSRGRLMPLVCRLSMRTPWRTDRGRWATSPKNAEAGDKPQAHRMQNQDRVRGCPKISLYRHRHPLPVTDASRPAGPGLDAVVQGLCTGIEWIAMAMCKPDPRGAVTRFGNDARQPFTVSRNPLAHHTRLRGVNRARSAAAPAVAQRIAL